MKGTFFLGIAMGILYGWLMHCWAERAAEPEELRKKPSIPPSPCDSCKYNPPATDMVKPCYRCPAEPNRPVDEE